MRLSYDSVHKKSIKLQKKELKSIYAFAFAQFIMFHHFENDWSAHHFTEILRNIKKKMAKTTTSNTLRKKPFISLSISDVTPSQK